MNDSGKGSEIMKLQSQNKQLEGHLSAYRQRLKDLTELIPKSELDRVLSRYGLKDILEVQQENGIEAHFASINGSNTPDLGMFNFQLKKKLKLSKLRNKLIFLLALPHIGIDVSSPGNDDQLLIETSNKHFAPIVPPRNIQNQINSTLEALKPSVGTKLEGLLLNSDSDSDFDPRADESDSIIMNGNNGNEKHSADSFFGFEPPKATMGQQLFAVAAANNNGNGVNMNGFANNNLTNGSLNGNGVANYNGSTNSSPPLRKNIILFFGFFERSF